MGENGEPREKPPDTPANRHWHVSHVDSAGLEPTPDTRHGGEMTGSALNRSATGEGNTDWDVKPQYKPSNKHVLLRVDDIQTHRH